MKVIDLLNKIANNEEVPKYISYFDIYLNEREKMYVCESNIIAKLFNGNMCSVKDEIEIIEENKEIEELDNEHKFYCYTQYDAYNHEIDKVLYLIGAINNVNDRISNSNNKINELVKAVNELKKGK